MIIIDVIGIIPRYINKHVVSIIRLSKILIPTLEQSSNIVTISYNFNEERNF